MARFLTNHFLPDFAAFSSKPCKYMIISILVFTLGDTRGKADEIADLHPYTRNRTKPCTPTQEIAQILHSRWGVMEDLFFLGWRNDEVRRSLNVTCNIVTMEATSSRTGRPSGSSDISSDAWLGVGLRTIRKYKKTFTTKFILAGLSEWSTQAFHFMKPFLAMRKGGDSDCRDPVFWPRRRSLWP